MARARAVSHRGSGAVKRRDSRSRAASLVHDACGETTKAAPRLTKVTKHAKAVPLRRVAPRFARFGRAKSHVRK